MKKTYFSLVELLVVIAILAVLMGILFPAVSSMSARARITKAKAEMNAVKMAVKAYESTYGTIPFADNSASTITLTSTQYARLIGWLTQVNSDNTGNLRRVRFLDPRPDGSIYIDPWENEYIVVVDGNYNGEVTIGGRTLYGNIFIYSKGPNGTDDNGMNTTNGGAKGTDDVNSWD